MLDTGFPRADVENDFLRARRRQFLATLANRLRGRRGDGNRLVPLDEVADPLDWRGQRQLGLQTIRLDTIVGTAGTRRDSTGQWLIDAYVTQVLTAMPSMPRPFAGSPR
jgi:hypothetical protein